MPNAIRSPACGRCAELAVTVRPECHFERRYVGRWMLFDDDADSESEFDVSSGVIRSSQLGSFTCKGKHWQLPYYKVLSVFDNSWCAAHAFCAFFLSVVRWRWLLYIESAPCGLRSLNLDPSVSVQLPPQVIMPRP